MKEMIQAARGEIEADLLVADVFVVNVLSGRIHRSDVAIKSGKILGFGDYKARQVVDGGGAFLCPGLVESHIHIESTLLSPVEFARAAAERGTSTVVCDPHEIANVLGLDGIRYFLDCTKDLPVSIYFTLPSCVPATHLENSGASLRASDLISLYNAYPGRIAGLGEIMNFPGVIHQDPQVMAKLEAARNMVVDGHAPGLKGKDLNAYILAGPGSDHECVTLEEAREKLDKGMFIMIREGSSEHNLKELLPLVTEHNWPNFSLVSDDRHPDDLVNLGHLDHNIRQAIMLGLDPIRAVQMATINPARYFGLKKRGAIAPGYVADMVLVDNLESFNVQNVILKGSPLGQHCFDSAVPKPGNSMHVAGLSEKSFSIHEKGSQIRVIDIIPGQIVTKHAVLKPKISKGLVVADPENDIVKLAVLERHRATGNVGLGFVRGLGLKSGAIASTVAHDSHNLIIAGTDDEDMLAAAREVIKLGGGLAVAQNGRVLEALALPIAGLMSDEPLRTVVQGLELLKGACSSLGITHDNPFMILSFLALPVIPELKLTDLGLVDVNRFEIVDLFVE